MHVVLETPGGTGLYLPFNVFGWLIATILISLGLWQITLNKKVVTSKLQLYSLLGFLCLCVPMFTVVSLMSGKQDVFGFYLYPKF